MTWRPDLSRRYEEPFTVEVAAVVSDAEIADILRLPGAPTGLTPKGLCKLIRDEFFTVLVATSDFVCAYDSAEDSGIMTGVTGALIARIRPGEDFSHNDLDWGEFGGANVCEIQAMPVAGDVDRADNTDNATEVRTRLLQFLTKCRRDFAIDVIRAVVETLDKDSLGLFEHVGFEEGNRSPQFISMIHLG